MNTNYALKDLPLADLEKIGLYKDGKFLLEQDDMDALLTGHRTEMISLKELKADGFEIDQLDAKLSVVPDWDNKLTLKIHPIYKEPKLHPLLNEHEANALINGNIDTLQKIYQHKDQRKTYSFEYDPETKEFIEYDPEKVIVPEKVNSQVLTDQQKDAFRNGEVIWLNDGTQFQYRASDRKGIRADRAALVLSILLDGGISYLIIRGIKALVGLPQQDAETEGYLKALDEIQQKMKNGTGSQHLNDQSEPENRRYTKTRAR